MSKIIKFPHRKRLILRNHYLSILHELEKYITHNHINAPIEAVKIFEKEKLLGIPTAISKHPKAGWFVIQTSGQGPYVIWKEKGNRCIGCGEIVQEPSTSGDSVCGWCDCGIHRNGSKWTYNEAITFRKKWKEHLLTCVNTK